MKYNVKALRSVFVFPGPWGGALGASLVFLAILLLPRESYALINYGTDISYQQIDTVNGPTETSTVQERFSFYFNLNSKPSSRLSLQGILRFDVLQNEVNPGSNSLELQPNVDIRLATSALQFGVGYRRIIRDESVISSGSATSLRSDSDDWYVDTTLRAGKLPTLRVRYEIRDDGQTSNGTRTSQINTKDLQGSLNYKVGPLFLNADYRTQTAEDKLTGVITDSTQITGQATLNQKIGKRIDLGLRDTYNMSQTKATNADSTRMYSNISEVRILYRPFRGLDLSSTYSYRTSDDTAASGKTTETSWFSTFNYALPKFLRFYGSYQTLNTDNPTTTTTNNTTIAGVSFSNTFGRYSFTSRYERRLNSTTTDQSGAATTTNDTTTDNMDWLLSARLKPYLVLSLSESYAASSDDNGKNTNNRFRLKADIGPVKNLTMNPYFDYNVATDTAGIQTTTKQLVLPANFRILLHQRLELNITENYNWSSSESQSLLNTTQTNNAVIRLTLLRPFPGTSISGDASFTTSSSNSGPATNTSAYSLRANWSKRPHTFAANFRYQTGTATPSSTTVSFLYGLVLKLKKINMGFQARYDYSVVMSTPENSTQTIYMLLNLKK